MNKQIIKRTWVLMIILCLFSLASFSQFKDIDFLRTAPVDGVKYLEAYITPWANAFGAGLNGGWYNTAKPHKFGGFDITINASAGIVPTSAQTFDASKIGLSASVTGAGVSSTVAGLDKAGPLMSYKSNGVTLASFNAPKGANWRYIPVPTAQVGIGLPLGTELKVRFIPKIKIKDGDVSLWGVGLLHSLTQYLPGDKALPFDVSLFAGYTKLMADVPLALDPDQSVVQAYTTVNPTTAFQNQNMKVNVEALNVSAIASLNLPIITFYGGIGYTKTRTGMELSGNFPLPVFVATPVPHAEYNDSGIKKGSDFPKMDIKNFSGMRANIGFRIKLAFVTIHADYTRAQYNVLTTGLGFSFR
jgi:hypothetical protein